MHSTFALAALSGLAIVNAQIPGATTIEGSPTYDGLPVPGTTGKLGNAAITQNNPQCVTYNASLPTSGSIQGYVSATANANGTVSALFGAFPPLNPIVQSKTVILTSKCPGCILQRLPNRPP